MKGVEDKRLRYVLLLGGNMGNIQQTFADAIHELKKSGDVVKQSALYRSEAWGMTGAPDFINQLVVLTTSLSPNELLTKLLEIEKSHGRERKSAGGVYTSRTIDIDILFADDLIIDSPLLVIPHPRLHERKFALEPLYELMPDYIHPVFHKSIAELKKGLNDPSEVSRI
mgnify:CR=1 FL=1